MIVIENGLVWNGKKDDPPARQTIIIEDKFIRHVVPSNASAPLPEKPEKIDASTKFIMPGLINSGALFLISKKMLSLLVLQMATIMLTGILKSCTVKVIRRIEMNEPGIFVVIFFEKAVIRIVTNVMTVEL